MQSLEEVKNYFVYHAPDEDARFLHERINEAFMGLAELLWEMLPPANQGSPDKTVMFRSLIDSRMKANVVVACYIPKPATENPQFSSPQ